MNTRHFGLIVPLCLLGIGAVGVGGAPAPKKAAVRNHAKVAPPTRHLPRLTVPRSARVYYIDAAVRELAFGVPPDAMPEAAWAKETWSGERLANLYDNLSEVSGSGRFEPSDTRLVVKPIGGGQSILLDMNGNVRIGSRDYLLKPSAFLRCFLALQPSLPKPYLSDHYAWLSPSDNPR